MSRPGVGFFSLALGAIVTSTAPSSLSAVPCYGVQQPFCVYPNNPGAMFDDVGPLSLGTTFQTWPDGSATIPGQHLTPQMNYTQIGVTFSSPIGTPFIANAAPFQVLEADSGGTFERDWIIADFVTPASAVGIEFPGGTTLYAYDQHGSLIGEGSYYFSGNGLFLGVASDIPIARAVVDRGADLELIDTFLFNTVPEPATAFQVVFGMMVFRHRHRSGIVD